MSKPSEESSIKDEIYARYMRTYANRMNTEWERDA
jgi:hypothetical protein